MFVSTNKFFLNLFLIVILFHAAVATAEVNVGQKAKVQAAFIYQFTNYITWPTTGSQQKTFVISIFGKDEALLKELESLAKTKNVKDQPIEVNQTNLVASLKKSHIVIVVTGELESLQEVVGKLKGSNTLIVSHAEGFANKGAMINFFLEEERLRFEINQTTLKNENLQASSRLLNLAKIVGAGE